MIIIVLVTNIRFLWRSFNNKPTTFPFSPYIVPCTHTHFSFIRLLAWFSFSMHFNDWNQHLQWNTLNFIHIFLCVFGLVLCFLFFCRPVQTNVIPIVSSSWWWFQAYVDYDHGMRPFLYATILFLKSNFHWIFQFAENFDQTYFELQLNFKLKSILNGWSQKRPMSSMFILHKIRFFFIYYYYLTALPKSNRRKIKYNAPHRLRFEFEYPEYGAHTVRVWM